VDVTSAGDAAVRGADGRPPAIPTALVERVRAGGRLDDADAALLLRSRDLLTLGALASERRARQVPGRTVTFIVDRNINYTNFCVTGCDFCAFHRPLGSPEGYLLSKDEIFAKVQETLDLGGTAVMMQGGLHPDLRIEYFEDLFASIKARFPITIHSLSPPEILYIARISGLDVPETLQRLRAAGLDSLPGGGAEILVDRVRRLVAPKKAGTDEWLGVMREAHLLGMGTTATMMFGSVETLEERVEHLRRIRELQDETGGFRAFIPWTFQAGNTILAGLVPPATAVDYLTTLAVSRIYLDNVSNIQASWVTQGLKVGQVALHFGANDLGSTMIEENVVAAAGVTFRVSTEELVDAIRLAGFVPVQRRTDYSPVAGILRSDAAVGGLFVHPSDGRGTLE
jgi:cyclic dehypoxanthinyl futalosine synthase